MVAELVIDVHPQTLSSCHALHRLSQIWLIAAVRKRTEDFCCQRSSGLPTQASRHKARNFRITPGLCTVRTKPITLLTSCLVLKPFPGLWPDFCNGSYTQYCDLSRQYDPVPSPNTTNGLPNGTVVPPYKGPNIGTFLEPFGRYDLLNWMNKYWINQGAPNSDFWGHEFSKHATCYSTFDVPCYGPEYVEHQDVVDFFDTAIKYYLRFPTYEWLKEANITPSNSTTYTLSDIQGQLAKKHGAVPYIGCSGPRYNTTAQGMKENSTDSGRTVVSEVWYYMNAYGRPQDGNTVPVNATGSNTSCAKAKGAILYPEMTESSIQGS
jgi:ribonuclease T2